MGAARRLVLVLVICFTAVAGCGGDQETDGSEADAQQERLYPFLKGPTREFLVPEGDNAVQTYGREATKAEREQASRVIEAWMRARAAKDFEKDCSYMSRAYRHNLVQEDAFHVSNGRVTNCPEALAYFGPEASGDFVNTMKEPIASLRVAEGHGFAQYHGNDGRDWVVPVDREDGRWKVATAAPIDRMK